MQKILEYMLTPLEIQNALKEYQQNKNDKKNNIKLKSKILLLIVVFILLCILTFLSGDFSYKLTLPAIFIIIILLVSLNNNGKLIFMLPVKNTGNINLSLILNSENPLFSQVVKIQDKKNNISFNWKNIENICLTENYIVIVQKGFIIIPKNIFQSNTDMQETLDFIQECYQKYKQ